MGFHSFEVADLNYKTWTDYNGTDDSQLNLFQGSVSALKEGFDKSQVITEIMLMRGFALTVSIQRSRASRQTKFLKWLMKTSRNACLFVWMKKSNKTSLVPNYYSNKMTQSLLLMQHCLQVCVTLAADFFSSSNLRESTYVQAKV